MYRRARRMRAFSEHDLSEYLADRAKQLRGQINSEDKNYILNVNVGSYISHLVDRHSVDVLKIDFDGISASQHERPVPAEEFPETFNVFRGKSYLRQVIAFHLPVSGDTSLLAYHPDRWQPYYPEITIDRDEICIERVVFSQTPEQIRSELDHEVRALKSNYEFLVQQIAEFNQQLPQTAEQCIRDRKQQLLEQDQVLAAIGVPIKKPDNLPQTYSVPTPQARKSVAPRPVVNDKSFVPDPTLDQQTYQDILQTIHDVGKVMERLPSTYRDKGEEALRDHFLLYLEPRYEGSATGETFNMSGKTDILIRHLNSNIFVAECKFWSGQKAFLETIDQLLGYLTWRDSKAAIIMFVRNREIVPVIQAVKNAVPTHGNYLGFVGEREDSWLSYRFHLNGDPNREVHLAVLLFHIP